MPNQSDAASIAKALGGKQSGTGWICRCPAHDDEHPSLSIAEKSGKILFHCLARCSQENVIAALRASGLWSKKGNFVAQRRAKTDEDEDDARINFARAMWDQRVPFAGTLAETYLRRYRRIEVRPAKHALGFLRYVSPGWRQPAMIAALRDGGDELTGVQLTFLDADTGRKADLRLHRKTFGLMLNSAVKVVEVVSDTLGLAEGIETALSAYELHGIATWATLSATRLGSIAIPAGVRRIRIFADNDEPGIEGARKAAYRYRAQGFEVTISRPALLGDYNDLLRSDKRG